MSEELDAGFMQALMQSMIGANPADLLKMMQGAKIELNASIEEIPLKISLRFKEGEILARVKITEEDKSEDGDKPET